MQHTWQLARATALSIAETSHRQFFFSSHMPEAARNVHHVYATVDKLGVVLDGPAAQPADISIAMGTLLRLDDGRYRMYYTVLSHVEPKSAHIAIAESDDGLHWQRVQLRHNRGNVDHVVFGGLPGDQEFVTQAQVLRMPDDGWRMYFWKMRDGHVRYTVATSSDGLQWTVPDLEHPVLYHPADMAVKVDKTLGLTPFGDQTIPSGAAATLEAKRLLTNDAAQVYYNDQLDRYECYSVWLTPSTPERRVAVDNAPGVVRTIQRRLSSDGLRWSAPELILKPDVRDPWDQQFYYLGVQWHEDWLIGSLGHYRVEDAQQTQDIELVFSRDGRTWERPLRGGFIPRDADGRDSRGIYLPNAWIDRGDHWLCLYSGTTYCHNEPLNPQCVPLCVMGATFAKNRFVGLAAGHTPGGFVSDPFFLQSSSLTVDADIRGWLRAELCDMWGNKLDGYHLMDFQALAGDSSEHILEWKNKSVADLMYTCLRVRFEYLEGTIYNLSF